MDDLSFDEFIGMIGRKPPYTGQIIYHFSNTAHPQGFKGHQAMCFTTEDGFHDVVSDSIDERAVIYRNECRVLDPSKLCDLRARADFGLLLSAKPESRKEDLEDLLDEYRNNDSRWYEATDEGAIEVISSSPVNKSETS